ncbi:Chromosome segregation ATPase [Geitlerinema sp. FC II]|nr:Chromosome segregation ATPase [Geitlerinema sp. FC II]
MKSVLTNPRLNYFNPLAKGMANTQGDPIRVRAEGELPETQPTVDTDLEPERNATDETPPPQATEEKATQEQPVSLLARVALSSKKTLDRLWGWPLFWFLVLVGFSSTAMGALVWLFSMPPVPDCKAVSTLAPDRERLYCAQQAAESGRLEDLEAAIALVESWPDDHPLQRQGKKFTEQWSNQLLDMARRAALRGELDVALGLLERIPKDSPTYPEAQTTIARWDRGWEQGQHIYNLASEALKNQNWSEAEYQAERLLGIGDDYWSEQRHDKLMAQIAAEKEGRRKLKQARESVQWETPYESEAALRLINAIEADTYARADARSEIEKWSQKVLEMAVAEQQAGNFQRALEAAETIPAEASEYARAREVVVLAESGVLTSSESNPLVKPVSTQILTLLEAEALSESLPSDHPLHDSARRQQPEWESHLQDLFGLQAASAIAAIGQPFALEVALAQAEAIESDRPRRVHAQTLVAYWRKEMERIADRPILRRAERLAELGTIEALEAAIEQAEQIPLGRAARPEAQALIARSRTEIARLEDRPILEEAEKLAQENEFAEAVELAQQIEDDRPLYGEARKAIDRWREEWRLYEDRPILDEAIEYAEEGKLTDAIATAAEIGTDSPIYYEAQGKIGEWLAERDGGNRSAPASSDRGGTPQTSEPAYEAPAPEPVYEAPAPEPVYEAPAPEPAYAPPPSEKKVTY